MIYYPLYSGLIKKAMEGDTMEVFEWDNEKRMLRTRKV